MLRKPLVIALLMGSALILAAAATSENITPVVQPDRPDPIWSLLLHCSFFGLLGIVLVTFGFKVFDWIITKIDLEAEVAKGNLAAAVLSAAAILGISVIVAAAIH